ncbi:c-type cytochrome biogenesis protein CcmI [Devosia sp.]|uniref:c-type cytochrome biogenesis protein CcmI n=1 Tax=Devosia sp. TaxID=1871048 RepID=UPI0032679EA3
MLLWLVATIVTVIACAALYYAAGGRMVNETGAESGPANRHFQLVLSGIDADLAAGRLGEAEAVAAKGELAREMLRQKADAVGQTISGRQFGKGASVLAIGAIAAVALGVYGLVGSPDLPGQPLQAETQAAAPGLDFNQAIAKVEAELKAKPDDLRGWSVIAPIYMQSGRYADAEHAFRRIMDLGDKTAKAQTDLAEALLMQAKGDASGEPMTLLKAAAALDPTDARSRFYIAGELTRTADYPAATAAWKQLLALSKGDEPWLPTAQEGLRLSQSDGVAPTDATASAQQSAMINGMVGGLATRLNADGGSIEDWTKLVHSYLVLGDKASAQAAYDKALAAYPKTFDRGDIDSVAIEGGLTLTGAKP